MTDEELRQALGPLPKPHVPEDQWVAWANGELSPAEASRLLAHVATCPECARVRRVVQELRDGAVPEGRAWGFGAGVVLALAAAAVLAVAVWSPPDPDVYRGERWEAAATVEGGLRVSAQPVPGADTYRLTVWGPDDTVAHRETGPEPVFRWSAPPGRWRWRVEALQLGGSVAATPIVTTEIP